MEELQPAAPGYDGTIKWFGPKWDAPLTDEAPQVQTPVGFSCMGCPEKIQEGDRGVTIPHLGILNDSGRPTDMPHHLECFYVEILGPDWAKLIEVRDA